MFKKTFFKIGITSLVFLGALAHNLCANTFTVTTTNISGPGSLAAAIFQANITPTNNLIRITVTNPIIVGVRLPAITNNLAIVGVASTPAIITGGGTLPLFTFASGTTNSLYNLILKNGYITNAGPVAGSAINNSGTLSVNNCVLTNNQSPNGFGGAINNGGIMVISSSLITGNHAQMGGGIYNTGDLTILQSTFESNISFGGNGSDGYSISGAGYGGNGGGYGADSGSYGNGGSGSGYGAGNGGYGNGFNGAYGGGGGGSGLGGVIFVASGNLNATNSTFCNNLAQGGNGGAGSWVQGAPGNGGSGFGGAVFLLNGNLSLVNCSITTNSCFAGKGANSGYNQSSSNGESSGGGIYNYGGTVSILNTIVAGNSTSTSSPDLIGSFNSLGYNLIGNNQGANNLSFLDYQNVSASIGSLTNNGGVTPTCLPLQGSYAIGSGTSVGAPKTDQRGVPRPQNGSFDMGAVQTVRTSPYVIGGTFDKASGYTINLIFDVTNRYRIQASTNLTTWLDIITNQNGVGLKFTDTGATNFTRRYYRTAKP